MDDNWPAKEGYPIGETRQASSIGLRWSVTEEIAVSWLVTIPASALVAGVYWLIVLLSQ